MSTTDHWKEVFSKEFEGTMNGMLCKMQKERFLVRLLFSNHSGIFLFCYAFGLLLLGSQLGDRFDAAHVHSLGLILMAILYFFMGASIPLFGLNGFAARIIFCVLWVINGVVQSLGWPTAVKLS